jgi:superfamily II DNA/RNA helicase
MCVMPRAGSGKTLAYLIPVAARLMQMVPLGARSFKPVNTLPIFSVIVAPTRELARQIFDEASMLLKDTGYAARLLTSGMDERKSILGKPGVRTGMPCTM